MHTFALRTEWDVADARTHGRRLALEVGFTPGEAALWATAVSEIADNAVCHGGGGELVLRALEEGARRGVEAVASDRGPGIGDLGRALEGGYSTAGSLGLGLSGARRMTDFFEHRPGPAGGTIIVLRKFLDGEEARG